MSNKNNKSSASGIYWFIGVIVFLNILGEFGVAAFFMILPLIIVGFVIFNIFKDQINEVTKKVQTELEKNKNFYSKQSKDYKNIAKSKNKMTDLKAKFGNLKTDWMSAKPMSSESNFSMQDNESQGRTVIFIIGLIILIAFVALQYFEPELLEDVWTEIVSEFN